MPGGNELSLLKRTTPLVSAGTQISSLNLSLQAHTCARALRPWGHVLQPAVCSAQPRNRMLIRSHRWQGLVDVWRLLWLGWQSNGLRHSREQLSPLTSLWQGNL